MTSASPSARVEVALPLPIFRTFTYVVSEPVPAAGTRVLVPFRRSVRIGWVVGPGGHGRIKGLRAVLDVLDDVSGVPADILDLCTWMAGYYVAPLGIALRSALPAILADASRDYVALTGAVPDGVSSRERRLAGALVRPGGPRRVATLRRELGMGSIWPEIRSLRDRGVLVHETVTPSEPMVKTRRLARITNALENLAERDAVFGRAVRQREAYELIEASGGAVELGHLVDELRFSRGVISGLEAKGLVRLSDEEVIRDPFAGVVPAEPPHLTPTGEQRVAIDALVAALNEPHPSPFLLHGVTGSGKTLVYIELLRETLARGRSALVLVPEISLTPQTVSRFRAHFGNQVAVLHSGLSAGERYDAWRQLRSGARRIAVGARSALFAPLEGLGAVVVDEEQEASYKQSEAPRYHARDLALVRARAQGAVCVLGSATPSLESWHNAHTGKFRLLRLPRRVGGASLPEVRVVDLRVGRRKDAEGPTRREGEGSRGDRVSKGGGDAPDGRRPFGDRESRGGPSARGGGVLGEELVAAVDARLRRSEQVILLLNRRGYSAFVQCRECGEVERCRNCSISLTYHRLGRRLVCHHCRYEESAPTRCPRCGSKDLSFRGMGTERVERVAAETFPGARIARMDVDTTSGKWAHERILARVERGEVDILLGTQMIAKGLDFPRVTLVGVVNADVGIHLPDFRASERTFQLLSQVAGRAGRGALGGEVIVQTSLPDHYALRAAVAHDFEGFARRELAERQEPRYPPHVRLVNVVLSSPDRQLAATAAEAAVAFARRHVAGVARASRRGGAPGNAPGGAGTVELVGPAPAPIERLHGRWRWHFFMRAHSPAVLGAAARRVAVDFPLPPGDVRLALDRDPVALL